MLQVIFSLRKWFWGNQYLTQSPLASQSLALPFSTWQSHLQSELHLGDLGPSRYDLPAEKGKNARRAGAAPIGFPIICECSLHFGHLRAPARRRPLPH